MGHRLRGLRVGLWIAFTALAARLTHLQVLGGAAYRQLAEHNRLRLVPEAAPRGLVVDRNGQVLASNETVFRVALVPQELEEPAAVMNAVSAVVHVPVGALERQFQRERTLAFMPATVVPQVAKDVAIRLEEERWRLPGLVIRAEPVRAYPQGSTAAHLLGYLSQPTAEELPSLKPFGIRSRALVGRLGLEQLLDHALQGQSGGLVVEVNHRARQVRVVNRQAPVPGATVALTVDASLQALIEQAFGAQPGAAVVLDPATGEVLSLVSSPGFAPEAFVDADRTRVQALLEDSASPLLNRAVVGAYQPGSIMKLITASAALEQRLITPKTAISCPGFLTIGDRTIHCWYRSGHGPVDLEAALMQSCNVYFMQVGRKLGAPSLVAAMEGFGLSQRTGWPLEQTGHLPRRRLSEGELALLAIGQGEILVTPLQAAVMVSVFANGGQLVQPWVVASIGGYPTGGRAASRRTRWAPQTLEAVRAGMLAVVRSPEGTGHRASSPLVRIAGKTGTAQTHVPGRTHGWFVGFCPVEHPRAAIAVVSEHGGSGGDLPAHIARLICEHLAASEQAAP